MVGSHLTPPQEQRPRRRRTEQTGSLPWAACPGAVGLKSSRHRSYNTSADSPPTNLAGTGGGRYVCTRSGVFRQGQDVRGGCAGGVDAPAAQERWCEILSRTPCGGSRWAPMLHRDLPTSRRGTSGFPRIDSREDGRGSKPRTAGLPASIGARIPARRDSHQPIARNGKETGNAVFSWRQWRIGGSSLFV